MLLGLISEGCHLQGNPCSEPCLGTYLHRVMSIRLGLASVTGESVVGAAGAHGSCQVGLNATFEGVGAWCQTTPLEQNPADSPTGELLKQAHRLPGSQFPICPGSLPPPPGLCRKVGKAWPEEGVPDEPRGVACWSSCT